MFDQMQAAMELGGTATSSSFKLADGRRQGNLVEAAMARLRSSIYPVLRTLSCEHHEGILIVRGRVPSYYHKQLAQESLRNLPGVPEILNCVEVIAPAPQ